MSNIFIKGEWRRHRSSFDGMYPYQVAPFILMAKETQSISMCYAALMFALWRIHVSQFYQELEPVEKVNHWLDEIKEISEQTNPENEPGREMKQTITAWIEELRGYGEGGAK